MRPKKNPIVSIQKERPMFTILGFVISLTIAFVTLSFTFYTSSNPETVINLFPGDGVEIPVTISAPPKKPVPIVKTKIQLSNQFKPVDNDDPIEPREMHIDAPKFPFSGFIQSDPSFTEVKPNIEGPDITYDEDELSSKPEFIGGNDKIQEFIKEHIIYPKNAISIEAEGIVMVSFIVEKDGRVTNVKIRGMKAGNDLDEEAIRVVKLFPNFKPGLYKKHPVRVICSIPIEFILD
ncbi:MAG: TonB family protein [Bacteroidia bacterium]